MRKNGWVKWLVVAVSAAVALTIPGVRATAAPEQGTQGGSTDDFVMPPLTYEEMPWDKDTPVLDPSVSVEEMAEMLGEGEDAADSGDSDSRYHEDRMQPIFLDTSEAFPAHYNDRDTLTNYLNQNLPPIRSQSPFGSCWAHAAMGLAELYCIRTENQTPRLDYSESHLAHFNFCQGTTPILSGTGYDQSELDRFTTRIADFNDAHRLNRGGNMAIAAETLMRRRGIALEDSFPYPLTEEAANNQTWENAEFADEVCLTDCYYINIRDNRDMAKYWIRTHGGLGVSFCATDSLSGSSEAYYNREHNAFYNYNASQTNHAVIAVGWDDTFPREYFDAGEHKPANNGAWLIRNSWSDGNGDDPFAFQKYFWMSYEDCTLSTTGYAYVVKPVDTVPQNYYHYDTQSSHKRYHTDDDDDPIVVANVFTAKEAERLEAVSFLYDWSGTVTLPLPVKVSVYLLENGETSLPTDRNHYQTAQPAARKEVSIPFAGRYTVELDEPIRLDKGQSFAVAVESPGVAVAYEAGFTATDYATHAGRHAGESYRLNNYLYDDGTFAYSVWADRGAGTSDGSETDTSGGNYCIGALTNPLPSLSGATIEISNEERYYTGKAIEPDVLVKLGNRTLTENTDYVVSYRNNIDPSNYAPTVTITGIGDYTGTAEKHFAINKAPLTVKAKDKTITYGDPVPTDFEVTYSGFVNGETESDLGATPSIGCNYNNSVADQRGAGTYDITPSLVFVPNYDPRCIPGTLTVKPKTVGLTWSGNTFTYNGSEQGPTATATGLVYDGDEVSVVMGAKMTDAGSHEITALALDNNNYILPTEGCTYHYTIEKAPISPTVTIEDGTVTTGPKNPVVTGNTENTAQTIEYKVKGAADSTYTTTKPVNAGEYTVRVTIAEGTNHLGGQATADFRLDKSQLVNQQTPPQQDSQMSCGVKTLRLSAAGLLPAALESNNLPGAGTIRYAKGGSVTVANSGTTTVSGFTVNETTGEISASVNNGTAGAIITLPVKISSTNYADVNVNFVVTLQSRGDAGVTFAEGTALTKTYGDGAFTLTPRVSETGNGTPERIWSSSNEGVATVTNTGRVTILAAGTATITHTFTSDTTEGTATLALTVDPKAVTASGLNVSNKVYDRTTDAEVTGSGTLQGVINGDAVSISIGTAAFSDKNVGNGKTVSFTGCTLTGVDAANYVLSAQPVATANITAKNLTATVTAADRVYNGERTVTLASGSLTGVLDGDTVTIDMTGAVGTMADALPGENKAVTVTGVALGGSDAGNYRLSAQPAGVTVTISRMAGAAAPTITTTNETVRGKGDGKITGATTAMEYQYRKNSNTAWSSTWTRCSADQINTWKTAARVGEYRFRIAETTTQLPSDAATVTVASGSAARINGSVKVVDSSVSGGTTDPTGIVSLTAKNESGDNVNVTYDSANHTYEITDLSLGYYNITATHRVNGSSKTATVLVQVTELATTGRDIVLPAADGNESVVTTTGLGSSTAVAIPTVLVGGLDQEAAALTNESGEPLTNAKLTMSITAGGNESNTAEGSSSDAETANKNNILDRAKETYGGANVSTSIAQGTKAVFLEINLAKIENEGAQDQDITPVKETANVLELVIPFDFTDCHELTVWRSHEEANGETSITQFTELSSKPADSYRDGTWYGDRANDVLYVYSSKFSGFSLAWLQNQKVTVTFNTNGGSAAPARQILLSGGYATQPAQPTRNGYNFAGWYNGNSRFNFSTPVTGDLTLTAHWNSQSNPVNPSSGGGSSGPSAPPERYDLLSSKGSFILPSPGYTVGKWITSDKSVATVSKGKVTAKNAGTVTITAIPKVAKGQVAPKEQSWTITVEKPMLTKATFRDKKPVALNTILSGYSKDKPIQILASKSGIVSVDEKLNIIPQKNGKVTLTVVFPHGAKVKAAYTVKIPDIKQASGKMTESKTKKLTIRNRSGDVQFKSTVPGVAEVDAAGVVTAVAPGTTQIQLVVKGEVYDTCTVTVNEPKYKKPGASYRLKLNKTMAPAVVNRGANTQLVSSAPGVVAVDGKKLRAMAPGTATIKLKIAGREYGSINVTVP